jgi:hypothetical protein
MLERIGMPYDFFSPFKITLRRLFGARLRKIGGKKDLVRGINRHEQDELFCSEYCYWVYEGCMPNKLNKLSDLPLPGDEMLALGIFEDKKPQQILKRRKEKVSLLPRENADPLSL